MLAGVGTAAAAPPPSQFVVIRFIPSSNEVTLTIPTPPCKHYRTGCVWRLLVNEPYAPVGQQLGVAYGSSGVLVVHYASSVCGTIQGDANVTSGVAGADWRYSVGHRLDIPCPTTPPSPNPAVTTTADPTGGGTTPLPGTGTPSATATAAPTKAVETAAVATLPFTGIDLTPMALIGMSMVLAGLLLASRFEERRRALRRLRYSARVQRQRAARASRWLVGE